MKIEITDEMIEETRLAGKDFDPLDREDVREALAAVVPLIEAAVRAEMIRPGAEEPTWEPAKTLTLVMEQGAGIEHAVMGTASRPTEVAARMLEAMDVIRETFP